MRGGDKGTSPPSLLTELEIGGPRNKPPFNGGPDKVFADQLGCVVWVRGGSTFTVEAEWGMALGGGGGWVAIVLTGSRLGVRLSSLLFMLCMDWVRAVNSLTGILTSSGRSINNTVIFNFNVSQYGIRYVR